MSDRAILRIGIVLWLISVPLFFRALGVSWESIWEFTLTVAGALGLVAVIFIVIYLAIEVFVGMWEGR